MKTKEIWKLWKDGYSWITGRNTERYAEPIYISNLGNVKGRKPSLDVNGYFTLPYKKKTYKVHKLVAELFIPNPENKSCIDHINRDRTDNRVENLRWATYIENNRNRSNNKEVKCKETGTKYNSVAEIPGYNKNIMKHFSEYVKKGYAIKGYHYEYIN